MRVQKQCHCGLIAYERSRRAPSTILTGSPFRTKIQARRRRPVSWAQLHAPYIKNRRERRGAVQRQRTALL
jgi:hypothetical protein